MPITRKQKKLYKEMANGRAAKLGRAGGKTTSKRGAAYFRKIAAQRKTFGGGRTPKPKCKCRKKPCQCKSARRKV